MIRKQIRSPNIIMDMGGKMPPISIDIEEIVIGTIINHYYLIAKYPYLKPEVFYKENHQIIYSSIVELVKNDKKPDLIILTDYLKYTSQIETIGGIVYLTELSGKEAVYIDNYVKVLMDKFFYRELIRLSFEVQNKSYEALTDPLEISDYIQSSLIDLMDFDGEVQNNFNKSLEVTINNIKQASVGENILVIKSGFKLLDKSITFRSGYICIIAGSEGVGKTKFVISLARGMLENEQDIAIEWFSMEDDRRQIICSFLAMDVKKTTKELQGINYKMSDKDINEIEEISKHYEKFNIEFYDKTASITTIITRAKRFSDKYKNHKRVIIIDNLGLIDCDKTGIERDDYIAAKLKDIALNTGSFIILVHHFTKEIARKQNLEDGYRPRKEYLKGSTRILDFVQQALFVNLPRKYPDLLQEEKQLELNFIGIKDIELSEENFNKHLWSINSQPCKDCSNLSDLRIETYVKLVSLLNNKSKDLNGKIITFADIIQRYTEYSNSIDIVNRGREKKYEKAKSSIYIFIIKRMFNQNWVNNSNSPRSQYLYGNNLNLKYHIDDLFIVEAIKNRDDDNLGDNTIFRFICDLGYCSFKEIPNDINYEKK